MFSPDSKWIAFEKGDGENNEIYLHAFNSVPGGSRNLTDAWRETGNWQISNGGGKLARWRRDGRELYYFAPGGKLMAVEVEFGSTVKAGVPRHLFTAPDARVPHGYGVTADGQRFLLPVAVGDVPPSSATVMLNWTSTLANQ